MLVIVAYITTCRSHHARIVSSNIALCCSGHELSSTCHTTSPTSYPHFKWAARAQCSIYALTASSTTSAFLSGLSLPVSSALPATSATMDTLPSAYACGQKLPTISTDDTISTATTPPTHAPVSTASPFNISNTPSSRHTFTKLVYYFVACALIDSDNYFEPSSRSSNASSASSYTTNISANTFLPTASLAVFRGYLSTKGPSPKKKARPAITKRPC